MPIVLDMLDSQLGFCLAFAWQKASVIVFTWPGFMADVAKGESQLNHCLFTQMSIHTFDS